ncbi:UDP-2,3-diacylglucosamine diphosphatase [Bdellovibrio reynosensis]|uniref:UDP-2,3-diacylglucosamine diphosphatase n=1 Tax=Bdellovibrio reynosensis TaxID=2835041 RepID=A0ABY4CBG7_9BACT|nr:UDP-2,3-diacylglucosamine diphosphatase [Bdellovibrio reynosensis]UOF01046.1 UDP-2,3-diacylglucosamine diphosphatase [Bdellovibrio reynosensis]
MEAWFLSDIHLKDAEERNGKILLRFLRSLLAQNPKQVHLFLLGDIFDLWVGGHDYFAEKFKDLVGALKDLKTAGASITFIEGNHDMHIENFFQKKLGIDVFVEAQYFKFDGITVRCEHGDKINQNDIAYKRYRAFVRNPLVKQLAIHLPGRFWNYIGEKASKKSRSISAHYRVKNEDFLITMIRDHIEVAYKQAPFDYIISGHMHVFDDHVVNVNGRPVRSVNLGSWFEETVKVFRIQNGQGSWVILD